MRWELSPVERAEVRFVQMCSFSLQQELQEVKAPARLVKRVTSMVAMQYGSWVRLCEEDENGAWKLLEWSWWVEFKLLGREGCSSW